MTFEAVNVIRVHLWGNYVGALAPGRTRGAFVFEYTPEWIQKAIELSPTSMPSRRAPYVFPGLSETTFFGLPPAIADALPDRFGNAIIDAELARRGASPRQVTALDRLAYTGQRSMGALEFTPERGPGARPSTMLDIGELVRTARDVIAGTLGSDHEAELALQQILAIGTSAGGARAKAVVNVDPQSGELRPGQFPQDGQESWLLKFDGVGKDAQLGETEVYGRVEYAYAAMARAAGIHMSQTRLLEENGRAHFMTRRFDRPGGTQKLHMQTLCALSVLDYNLVGVHDYAQYQQAIAQLALGEEAAAEAFRRMVFNYAAANCDDHTKNFSFLMDEAGQWSLAPAYDITHAFNPAGPWTFQHLMGVEGKFQDVTKAEFMRFAERHGVPGARTIINDVTAAIDSWSEFANTAGLTTDVSARIGRDHTPQKS
jgi:serine/threonine-protein kinase HipA